MSTSPSEIEQTYAMFSGRAQQRIQLIKPGLISIDGASLTRQCTLGDITDTGARISVSNSDNIPDEFLLISRAEDLCASSCVVWRRGNDLGLAFSRRGQFTDADNMRNQLRVKCSKVDAPVKQAPVDVKKAKPEVAIRSKKTSRAAVRKKFPGLANEIRLLGLDPNTSITSATVKSAFRGKALTIHPDMGGDPEAFRMLSDAYYKLMAACKVARV